MIGARGRRIYLVGPTDGPLGERQARYERILAAFAAAGHDVHAPCATRPDDLDLTDDDLTKSVADDLAALSRAEVVVLTPGYAGALEVDAAALDGIPTMPLARAIEALT